MDVLKYTMDGENKVSLAGAKFQLLDKDGNAISFTEVAGAEVPTYTLETVSFVSLIELFIDSFICSTIDCGKFESSFT